MGGVGYFSAVSNIVQHMLTEVFNDEAFMEEYFAENSRRLGAAYAEFTGGCSSSATQQHGTIAPMVSGTKGSNA